MESKNICYYAGHVGCLNATQDSSCRLCAERLSHAVQHVLYPGREASEIDDATCGEHSNDTINRRQDWHTVPSLAIN
ncbi:MAG: hypothetical protein ACXV3U_02520 [Halobacteriota archaeon]